MLRWINRDGGAYSGTEDRNGLIFCTFTADNDICSMYVTKFSGLRGMVGHYYCFATDSLFGTDGGRGK